MAIVVNTNVSSLNAQRNLVGSGKMLSTALQRLSSGLRINSAKAPKTTPPVSPFPTA